MPELGQTISHYRIVEKIGQGGMGEVYLADDKTLDRRVALKFLPEIFTNDPERMARFEREAKLLASLNHPNIAGIYGLEQADGNRFLVLEYVEGETLQARLRKGALPLEDALELCRQIAEGLEAAHEKGVIHRDLKPANVMITADEKVKILDFGLAKALADETQSIDPSDSPTITAAMTQPGVVLGTAAYMSPEQAKGKTVDKRADIWAFGCLLYECLTGKKAFDGETVTETLAAILRGEPDWNALPSTAPQNLRFVLRRCLEKDKKRRFRDIADVQIEIEETRDIGEVTTSVKQSHPWLAWSIATLCLVCAFILGFFYFYQTPSEAPLRITEVSTPPTSESTSLVISPDGRYLAYVGLSDSKQMLWLRQFDKRTAQPLKGTEAASFPFWSPDSKSIGFFAEGKLKRIEIAGGMPVPLANAPIGLGGTWNQDDVIVFTPNLRNPLYRVPATGGNAEIVTKLDLPRQTSHHFPQFLPDGKHLLYLAWGADEGIYITSLDSTKTKFLCAANSNAVYAEPGYLLYLRRNTLFAHSFDTEREELLGDRFQIADSVERHPAFNPGGFSVSRKGMLAYRTIGTTSRRQLAWFDRSGNKIRSLGEPAENLYDPELSFDGTQVLITRVINQEEHTWLVDDRGVFQKFTNESDHQLFPIWSPDFKSIVFSISREGYWDLYRMPANGSGHVEKLLGSLEYRFAVDWSLDGRYLLYLQFNPKTGRDLWVLPMFGEGGNPKVFINTIYEERNGQFSPDSKWIAYQSDESGRFEIYVQPFPEQGEKKKISDNGGVQPRWYPDGDKLFYIASDGNLMEVPIQVKGQSLKPGTPVPLFLLKIPRGGFIDIMRIQYDVSRDGQRFLVNTTVDEPIPSPIAIVTNWTKLLDK